MERAAVPVRHREKDEGAPEADCGLLRVRPEDNRMDMPERAV